MTNLRNSLKNSGLAASVAASVATGALVADSVDVQNIAMANKYFSAV